MKLRLGVLAWVLAGVMARAETPVAEALMEAGHWKRARVLAASRLAAHPNDAEAVWWMARVELAYGDLERALPLAEKAVSLDGRNAVYRAILAQVYGRMAQRASVLRQIGLARRCKRELDMALELNPNHVHLLIGYMEYLWQAPGIVGGDKKKAREIPERVGDRPGARYHAAAQLAQWEQNTSKLEDLYRKAAEADPRCYEARTFLAGLYLDRNPVRFDLVEKYARAALGIDPGRAGAYAHLAAGYALQERWPEMETTIAQAEKNVPDDLAPSYAAGNALLRSGKSGPRQSAFRKYLTQNPGGAPAIWTARWRSTRPEKRPALKRYRTGSRARLKPESEVRKGSSRSACNASQRRPGVQACFAPRWTIWMSGSCVCANRLRTGAGRGSRKPPQ
jgi:tetratricopeptide (TPR) repeat protein